MSDNDRDRAGPPGAQEPAQPPGRDASQEPVEGGAQGETKAREDGGRPPVQSPAPGGLERERGAAEEGAAAFSREAVHDKVAAGVRVSPPTEPAAEREKPAPQAPLKDERPAPPGAGRAVPPPDAKLFTLSIDGTSITVPQGTLVIRAAEQLGIYIPRFCDHPYLDPLGACRQCLVEVEGQRKPLTACTTQVADGMVVRTQFTSRIAADSQAGVLELLLINHPLDCPMCDKGGECPLQDQALGYGPGGSRFIDQKRRYVKPVRINPLVLLDRERCVLCARCTRFASEISGDPFIELFERSALEQVAIYEDEEYRSPFSGNITQICPVGALLPQSFRFKARPFDMSSAAQVCNLCASGCNQVVQERRGEIVRVLAGDNPEVNREWNCDKGRFGYAYVNHPDRLTQPLVRRDGTLQPASWGEAVRTVVERIDAVRRDGRRAAVLAGGHLPDEDAYALSRFARTVLRTNDVDSRADGGTAEEDEVLRALLAAGGATYQDIDAAPVVIVAGLDAREESPILFLRLFEAARNRGARIVEIGPRATALSKARARSVLCRPGSEGAVLLSLAATLAAKLDGSLDESLRRAAAGADVGPMARRSGVPDEEVWAIARLLGDARGRPVVLAGERLARSPGALSAAWNLSIALGGTFGWVPRRANQRGALWAGLHPHLLPGGRAVSDADERRAVEEAWGEAVPAEAGRDRSAILSDAAELGFLLLAAADPVSDRPAGGLGGAALEAAPFVVALDLFLTESSSRADVVLPVAALPERSGTLTNWEGRTQASAPIIAPPGAVRDDGEILSTIAGACGVRFPARRDDLRREMDALRRPPETPRPVAVARASVGEGEDDGRLEVVTYALLLGGGNMLRGADLLLSSRDPVAIEIHPDDGERLGVADGDVVRVSSSSGEVRAPARITASVAPGAVFVPGGDAGGAALLDGGPGGTFARVEKA